MDIEAAVDGWRLDAARKLFTRYARSLDFSLDFQDFETELASLPGKYAPPGGTILLALANGAPAGCVALRPLEQPGVCEMKRLFVAEQHRGLGLGRTLAELAITRAHTMGYTALRLDTLASMTAANKLYDALGFREISPYCDNPFANARYLELALHGPGA